MRKLALALTSLLALLSAAQAQVVSWPPPPGSIAILCVYTLTPSTWATTNAGYVQCDNNGRILTTNTPSGTQDVNLTKVGGATFALGQALMAASLPVTIASNQGALLVTPSNPIGITPTDRTVTSATGASQTLMALNASRRGLIIENTGNANCGVNPTGGTAAIAGAGTLTLVPNGSYQPRIPTLSAITVICTAGQPIYAEEN